MDRLKLKEIAERYFDTNIKITKDSLCRFLINYEYDIAKSYNYDCHKEDVMIRLRDCDYDLEKIPDKLLNEMTDLFEDRLADNSSENGWIYILDNVIDYYEEDLKEYYLRVEE